MKAVTHRRPGTLLAKECDAVVWRVLRLVAVSLVLAVSACVVLPEVAEPPEPEAPWIRILREKVDPPLLVDGIIAAPLVVEPGQAGNELVLSFSAKFAVESARLSGGLHHAWYYDYKPNNIPAVSYTRCGGSEVCTLAVCAFFQSTSLDHTLLLVVSDRPLPTGATAPLGFEPGTTFDWVEWNIEITSPCP